MWRRFNSKKKLAMSGALRRTPRFQLVSAMVRAGRLTSAVPALKTPLNERQNVP